MIILGIDPGTVNLGFAFLKTHSTLHSSLHFSSSVRKIQYLHSGTLKFSSQIPFVERLFFIQEAFSKVVSEIQPDEVAFEAPIFVKNPTVLSKLAQVRGALMATLGMSFQKKIFEYSPNLVKQTTTGFGHADKLSVQKFLQFQFPSFSENIIQNGGKTFSSFDESDALLVALCHLFTHHSYGKMNNKMLKKSTKKTASKKKNYNLAESLGHLTKNN